MAQTMEKNSVVRVGTKNKSKMVKIAARLSLEDGRTRSMEDITNLLLETYEKYIDSFSNNMKEGGSSRNSNMRHINLDKGNVREFADKFIKDNKETFDRLSKL